MGKKTVAVLGSENEGEIRQKESVKREQKKMRAGKVTKTSESEVVVPEEEVKKVKQPHVRSQAYQDAKSKVSPEKSYSISEALKLLRTVSLAKFDSTVELHLTMANPTNKSVDLPYSTGKTRRIAIANEETVKDIEAGKINFDVLYASPEQMAKLVKFAKVLGPKGLMPNPKTGTVVPDPEKTVKSMAGKNSLTLKTEKDVPLIHTIIGKLSQPDKELEANIQVVLTTLSPQITKTVLKSTMSPAIKLVV